MKRTCIFNLVLGDLPCRRASVALAAALVLTGCGPKPQAPGVRASAETSSTETAAPRFSAKKGLFLPEQTKKSIGLKIVEVTEDQLNSAFEIEFRVYQKRGATALASGMVTPGEAKLFKVGQELEVRLTGGQTRQGNVASVEDGSKRVTGFLEVIAQVPQAPEALAEGAFFQASVQVEQAGNVTTIPRSALLECSEGNYVYTVSGEHLVRTAVKVGSRNMASVEVTEGLYAGDQVVAQPVRSLWMTELAAVKGGQSCCVEPPRGK